MRPHAMSTRMPEPNIVVELNRNCACYRGNADRDVQKLAGRQAVANASGRGTKGISRTAVMATHAWALTAAALNTGNTLGLG